MKRKENLEYEIKSNPCRIVSLFILSIVVTTLYFIYANENVQEALAKKLNNFTTSLKIQPKNKINEKVSKFDFSKYKLNKGNENLSFDITNNPNLVTSKRHCKLPLLNPFNKTIMESFKEPEKVVCSKDFPLLFESDVSSSKIIFLDDIGKFDIKSCCYKFINQSTKEKSNKIIFEESKECNLIRELETDITGDYDAISVYCENSIVENTSLIDILPLIRKKPLIEMKLKELKNSGAIDLDYDIAKQYNVVVLGIDAVSHMNFKRTMPKTSEYIVKELKGIEMNGLTKVGDNTFPILIPALTGKSIEELERVCSLDSNKNYFDFCPFIWTDFKNKGYYTTYFEDAPRIGIFNYLKKGFKGNPVDYFLEPFFKKADNEIGNNKKLNANLCYGPRLAFDVMLDVVKKMAYFGGEEKDRRYFEFMWATSLFHDYVNYPKLGDKALFKTIRWMKNEGYLNNTILILMSDHGIRWGEITKTMQGQIEARMPFLYLILPDKFRQDHEQAVKNVNANTQALTSHFDFYETLKDLLDLRRISNEKLNVREMILKKLSKMPRGISLFLPIPHKRTCSDAGIPIQYCVCHSKIETEERDKNNVERGANEIINYLNNKLQKFPECEKLALKEIVSSKRIMADESELNQNESKDEMILDLFEITVSAIPGRGVFETLIVKESKKKWSVKNVIRTTLYGNDSICVNDNLIKNYCFCKPVNPIPFKST